MNFRKMSSLLLIAFALGTGLGSQEMHETSSFRESIPHVSGLQGEVRNNLLRLTWIDSPDMRGPVFIYSSLFPFDEAMSFTLGRPIMVHYGLESYIDEVDYSGIYYYLVVASDEHGRRNYVLYPGNTISIEIAETIDLPARFPLPVPVPDTESVHGISSFTVMAESNRVIIDFRYYRIGNLVLYRSTRPIRRAADLSFAVRIRNDAFPPFEDSPVPGIPYYYAIIPEDDLTRGTMIIRPGVNATINPVEIPVENIFLAESTVVRTIPLLSITDTRINPELAARISAPVQELSTEAERLLANMTNTAGARRPASPLKETSIFSQELWDTAENSDSLLRAIIQGSFMNGQWETAADELKSYLFMSGSRDSQARAWFYLGQSHYFSGRPRDALLAFLSASQVFPDVSAAWVRACLTMMTE